MQTRTAGALLFLFLAEPGGERRYWNFTERLGRNFLVQELIRRARKATKSSLCDEKVSV